ncbi:MAG TPA: VWA domain-containing protein [Bdellovibrionales bacterium]|nr:VWA domain-containing protein [Bdellovibrionales bacterium]
MFDYRFEDPAALQLLWLVPLVVFLIWWTARRTAGVIERQMNPKIAAFLTRSVSPGRRKWKNILQCLTLALFVFSLARPQSGEGKQKAKSEGLEIMLAVDVSNSMLAEDARPSRLELAKRELSRFIDRLGGDKVGLVAFAGSAILLSPLTNDKAALKMFLESLTPDSVATQGTDFKRAIDESFRALQRGGTESDEQQKVTRVIVLVSDGEETEKGGLDAAEKATADGVRIFTLGVGTEQGGQIPVRDRDGNLAGYKRDTKGQVVVTKFTDEAMKALAQAGQGSYQHVTFGGDAVQLLRASIDRLEKAQFDSLEVSHYNEHYQTFLFVAILLALSELALGERKREGRIWRGRFEAPMD